MARATLNGVTLAESTHTEVVEGNHYFPPESVSREYMSESRTHTHCPWKGDASYYGVTVGDDLVEQHKGPRGVLRQQGRGGGLGICL